MRLGEHRGLLKRRWKTVLPTNSAEDPKLIVVAIVVGAILLMTTSTAWAAQGQITEVNPSGRGVPHGISNIPLDILVVLSVVANPFSDILAYFLLVGAFG